MEQQVPFGQWVSSLSSKQITDELIRPYDKNGNGVLEAGELQALLQETFSLKVTEEEVELLKQDLDKNQDGSLGVNELRAFLRVFNPETRKLVRKTALLVVDVQNDFISGTLAVPSAADIVPMINGVREKFDAVVISYDWHPKGHCSFVEAAREGSVDVLSPPETYDPFSLVMLKGDADRPEHQQMLYPRHCVQGEWGAECHAELVLKDSDLKIYKGVKPNIDSYSAFFDNMKANDTGLTAMLEKEAVTDVYCCGLVTDICVKATALHSAEMGFNTFVIEDACKPFMADSVQDSLRELADAGVQVLTAAEAVKSASVLTGEVDLEDYLAAVKRSKNAASVHNSAEKRWFTQPPQGA